MRINIINVREEISKREIVEAICALPDLFRSGSASTVDLVRLSGLPESPEALTRAEIVALLAERPELIDGWLRWSEDKRTSSGWFFVSEAGAFVVGFHPEGERLVFSDCTEACAEFVLREIADLVASLRSNNMFKGRRAKRARP